MNKKLPFLLVFCMFGTIVLAQDKTIKHAIAVAQVQAELLVKETDSYQQTHTVKDFYPRSLDKNGNVIFVGANDWTSGFPAGTLWYLYALDTTKKNILKNAIRLTASLKKEQWNAGDHDIGFKIYCSFGNGYRFTKDTAYRTIIINAAHTLATRFNPKVGCIRSWDFNKDKWKYPVIIDNMMNLELLFAATRFTGDSSFYKIAVAHANTTLSNHFRKDFSSYHLVDYDPQTGKAIKKQTHQGYSDSSAWARGQGWGIYAYTFCYRETGNKLYLKQAESIAKYIFNNPTLPADGVPYWDYNAPNIPNEPRDVSAATLVASALYELFMYSTNGKKYKVKADLIINSVIKKYSVQPKGSKGFLLLNSTGSKPHNSEIDVPLNYADYYFLEALYRKNILEKNGTNALANAIK